ncbi:MAG: hypothetical protein COC19_05570 [SAR86 cluster bacterium]|uniref:Uncharacterized protein n=1 Tax=SAR86 cluster bacterium TaxID=2030880 RepID=A0A2A4MLP5_9GAMM|nr:MAG: hypothetical protein COC19_05570 [SAR86 cluster bacterium]
MLNLIMSLSLFSCLYITDDIVKENIPIGADKDEAIAYLLTMTELEAIRFRERTYDGSDFRYMPSIHGRIMMWRL